MSSLSGVAASHPAASVPTGVLSSMFAGRRTRAIATVPTVLVAITVATLACHLRLSLAESLTWQCDEIPLLVRFTGMCGHATNEAEATRFAPSFYTGYMGALRSLRPPKDIASLHTTTGFWTNLSLHLFGYSPGAGRAFQTFWSVIAIAAAGWAAWLAVGSIYAVCFAAWMVALSPHATAYAAQARGYAEAIALAPLLLIALEHFRRKPDRWLRCTILFLIALQLSLTIYTAWIYWVLPVMLLSVVILSSPVRTEGTTRSTRALLIMMLVGLGCFMTVYTVDRWTQLTFTASVGGDSIDQPGQLWGFLNRLMTELFPSPVWLLLLALLGVWVVWRSPMRWWLWMIAAGVVVPILFALSHGSPGYVRTFGYMLVPVAILFGAGADLALRVAARRFRPATVGLLAALAMTCASVWAYGGLEQRARAVILPDWGEVVLSLDEEPETAGPRWICQCLANHWQINWYREPMDYDAFLQIPLGESIEVVMGAQLDHDGKAKVFRRARGGSGIVEEQIPEYLATVTPQDLRCGVELRRWRGTRQSAEAFASVPPDAPVFVLADLTDRPSDDQWKRFLDDIDAGKRGVVTFKPAGRSDRPVDSMIVPADLVDGVSAGMQRHLHAEPTKIHFFALSPLFEAQSLDGIEPGGAGGGVDAAD